MKFQNHVGALLVGLQLALCACGDDAGEHSCPPGSEGCACTQGGSCDEALSCLSKLCVAESSEPSSRSDGGIANPIMVQKPLMAGGPAIAPRAGTGGGMSTARPQTQSLSGTWTGTLRSASKTQDATFAFSDAGNMLFRYQGQNGIRAVELTMVGQRVQWVPSGGGVFNLAVNRLMVSPGHVSVAWQASFEKSSDQILDQLRQVVDTDFVLAGADLQATQNVQTATFLNGNPQGETTATFTGTLRRQ